MIGTQYKWLAGTNFRKLFTHVKKELKTKCSTFPTKEKKIDGFMGLLSIKLVPSINKQQ